MTVKYYFESISGEKNSREFSRQLRLFSIIDDSYYWAIEWTSGADSTKFVLSDFNAGFMSRDVRDVCANLNEIQQEDLETKFGSIADYIERCIFAFKEYISTISPGEHLKNVAWEIESKN